jgi:hypothetical protein
MVRGSTVHSDSCTTQQVGLVKWRPHTETLLPTSRGAAKVAPWGTKGAEEAFRGTLTTMLAPFLGCFGNPVDWFRRDQG